MELSRGLATCDGSWNHPARAKRPRAWGGKRQTKSPLLRAISDLRATLDYVILMGESWLSPA